jgi:hypothetical protein
MKLACGSAIMRRLSVPSGRNEYSDVARFRSRDLPSVPRKAMRLPSGLHTTSTAASVTEEGTATTFRVAMSRMRRYERESRTELPAELQMSRCSM